MTLAQVTSLGIHRPASRPCPACGHLAERLLEGVTSASQAVCSGTIHWFICPLFLTGQPRRGRWLWSNRSTRGIPILSDLHQEVTALTAVWCVGHSVPSPRDLPRLPAPSTPWPPSPTPRLRVGSSGHQEQGRYLQKLDESRSGNAIVSHFLATLATLSRPRRPPPVSQSCSPKATDQRGAAGSPQSVIFCSGWTRQHLQM